MSHCRVYLLTYRRNQLLPRALHSLLNQTFTDWICELHNDDPTDSFPGQLVEQIGDSRIKVINHKINLGPTATFNLVFEEVSEPFICLLEDDNWWEPHFLQTMVDTMQKYPKVQVAWANMQFWQEEADGSWTDTGRSIWDYSETDEPRLFTWGQPQQIMGALHSNGAMMVRSAIAKHLTVPEETPFSIMEAARERTFPFPILLIPKVCANFAVTRATSRSQSRVLWSQMQTLLAASFLKHVSLDEQRLKQLWVNARSKPARSTGTLFFSAFVCPDCRLLLHYATLEDWLFFIASFIKHPMVGFGTLQARRSFPNLWQFLDQQTALRVEEAQHGNL